MKHILLACMIATPVVAQQTAEPVPPTILKIEFDSLQLNLENGTIELIVNKRDLQALLSRLPDGASISLQDDGEVAVDNIDTSSAD